MFEKLNIRYVFLGILNTIFGYFIGVITYIIFYEKFGIIFVGIVSNFLAITFTFLNFKIFFFKTKKKNFFGEYFKSLLSYGLTGVIGIILLWMLIEMFKFNIFISQFLIIITIFVLNYILNTKFVYIK